MRLLENEKGESVAQSLEDILKEGRIPSRIRSDKKRKLRSRSLSYHRPIGQTCAGRCNDVKNHCRQ